MTLFICLLEIAYLFLWMRSGNNIFLIVAIGIFLWWIYERRKEAILYQEKIEKDTVKELEKVSHNRRIVSDDCLTALLLDEYTRQFYYAEREDVESDFEIKKYSFDEIYECAIVENGYHFSLISKGGIHGWSLIENGNQVFTDEAEEEEDADEKEGLIKKLSLKIIVDDLSQPLIEFVFIEDTHGIEKDSEEYKELWEECKNWHQKIGIIIKRESNESVAVNSWAHN